MIKKFIKKCINKCKYEVNKFKTNSRLKKSSSEIESLYHIHEGERCFIIGNGPSLKGEDLSNLKKEICFSSNRIYHIFSETDWQPTYYCAQDEALINASANEISHSVHAVKKMLGIIDGHKYKKIKNACYLRLILKEFYPELPNFSENPSEGIYEGYTVTYMCIQLAAYMGFKEIYLLGVDHNYSVTRTPDGKIEKQKGIQDHFSEKDHVANIPQIYKSTLAYQAAEKYAEEHGIKIYNATRGGRLEVFERVDFDSLF